MNEQDLKDLWQTDRQAPTIDFAEIQRLSTAWEEKLRRKARIDIWSQIASVIVAFLFVLYYPGMIFVALLGALVGIWYVRELRKYYKIETGETGGEIKHLVQVKTEMMKSHFRRTRAVLYLIFPITVILALYGFGAFNKSEMTFSRWLISLTGILIITEILVIILTEIYFWIFYKPELKELQNLLKQLD